MASKRGILFFIAMVAATFHSSAAQRTHVVGDALWIVPPPVNFSSWASGQTFTVGDILVFNFTTGRHDVAEVTRAEYDACRSQSPISISNTGPTNITLSSAGEHFYICTFAGHCAAGQKLAINMSGAPSSPTTPAVSTPPSPSYAPNVVVEALPITLLSIGFALFY